MGEPHVLDRAACAHLGGEEVAELAGGRGGDAPVDEEVPVVRGVEDPVGPGELQVDGVAVAPGLAVLAPLEVVNVEVGPGADGDVVKGDVPRALGVGEANFGSAGVERVVVGGANGGNGVGDVRQRRVADAVVLLDEERARRVHSSPLEPKGDLRRGGEPLFHHPVAGVVELDRRRSLVEVSGRGIGISVGVAVGERPTVGALARGEVVEAGIGQNRGGGGGRGGEEESESDGADGKGSLHLDLLPLGDEFGCFRPSRKRRRWRVAVFANRSWIEIYRGDADTPY